MAALFDLPMLVLTYFKWSLITTVFIQTELGTQALEGSAHSSISTHS